jgi:Spy/CpxP family protein refolding chaperone
MYRNVRRRVGVNRQTGKWIGRTFLFFASTLATCLVTSRDASATSVSSAAPKAGQAGRGGDYPRVPQRRFARPSIDARAERLARQLNLNEVQQFELKKLLERQRAEVNRLWDDQVVSPIDRVNKLRALHEDTQEQFRALLTEEQRKKYDQLRNGGPATPPQQENDKNVH